ncbi:MAG: acyltransferase [candidate division Zixibacteria bacterium]|nr:acyltransferase [candidate division Zixibacteria bacterium]
MKIGFFQFSPLWGRNDENVERAISSIRGAKADLLVLPELFNTGYLFENQEELKRSAEFIPDGPTFSKMAHLAAQENVNLVFGIAEKEGERFFNSSVLVTPRRDFLVYRKLHLFDREKLWFSPGDKELKVFDIGSAKVGMMICFDWIFPETARILALKGAEIICHPSNLILQYCQRAMTTRCIENGVFSITANRTGTEEKGGVKLTFTGNSQIVDPKGNVLANADELKEGVWTVDIDPALARDKKVTPHNHLFEDRRIEFYRKGNLC